MALSGNYSPNVANKILFLLLPLETFGKNCQVLSNFYVQTQSQDTLPKMLTKEGSRRYEQIFG